MKQERSFRPRRPLRKSSFTPEELNKKPEETEPFIMPQCPYELEELAKDEWERVVPIIAEEIGLSKLDLGLIAIYCQEIAKYWECEKILKDKSLTMSTSTGYEQQRPEVSIGRNALSEAKEIAGQFGFSILSRKKLTDKPNPKTRSRR